MDWKIVFYVFLIIAFLVFLKLSTIKVNGNKVLGWSWRIILALIFPLVLILVILFGSLIVLGVMVFLLVLFLIFLGLFFLRKFKLIYKTEKVDEHNRVVIHSVKKK